MNTTVDEVAAQNSAAGSELARVKQELRRTHEMYLRVLADFDSYRQRTDRERARVAQEAKREIILALIELLDRLERDETAPTVSSAARAGAPVNMRAELLAVLAAQEVRPYDSIGQRFDPRWHEAVETMTRSGRQPGQIVAELRRGYRWHDEVLRPALVRVAQ